MLPELIAQMGGEFGPFDEDYFEEEDEDLPPFFLPLPGRGKSSSQSKKRKPWYQL